MHTESIVQVSAECADSNILDKPLLQRESTHQ